MYYKVITRAGHVGARKEHILTFAIEAPSIIDATRIAKTMPMVKHTKNVLSAIEITQEEFEELRTKDTYYNMR